MRKKQLYAILLAGVVAAGSAPSATWAAEVTQTTAEATESSETAGTGEGDSATATPTNAPSAPVTPEQPADPTPTTSADPTETPTDPTETPTDPTGTPADPTETPTEPTATPTDPTATPGVTETPQTRAAGDPVENTDTGVYISFTDESGTETKKEYYETLQYAVNAALKYYQATDHDPSKAVVVKIEKQFFLSETVRIENGKINIVATTPDVSIGRIDPEDNTKVLEGDMFVVSGANSELQLSTEGSDSKFVISGDTGSQGPEKSSGSLIKVENEGSFGMSSGVVLTANNSTADGAAIDNKNGGSVVLKGGSIVGNTGSKGAVYTNKDIAVQGTVQVKDNTGANLYLADDAAAVVTDVLTGSSISLTSATAADGKVVVKAGVKTDGTEVSLNTDTIKQFSYEDENYTIELGQDGKSATLKSTSDPEQPEVPVTDGKITGLEQPLKFFPGKGYKFKVVGAGFDNNNPVENDVRWNPIYWAQYEKPTEAQKQTNWSIKSEKGIKKAGKYNLYVFFKKQIYDGSTWSDTNTVEYIKTTFQSAAISDTEWDNYTANFLSYQKQSWTDANTVKVTMSTTADCKWYYYLVDANTSNEKIEEMYDEASAKEKAYADSPFVVTVKDVPDKDVWLIVAAKPNNGAKEQLKIIKLDARPEVTPSVTTRAPRKYEVSESTITGLENPLQFFPRKFYDFQVVGAGQNDKNPISGDERWIPQYWSMSVNGTKNTSWRIGSQENGIREAATYPLYVFFKKQTFNGSEWVDTDVVEYMKTSFSSAAISDEEWNDYIDSYNQEHPDDGLNYDGTSAGSVANLTPTEAASEQDTGATTRSAADTADYSPIGSMSALAALSLLAGGYVIVRKRKKEEI